ncbi:MAG: transcriptional repressor LexA [Alcaligenaceae bacterium]|nr:transcriptional repressor LexA [Alcaligenaceae bacterium]
MSIKLTDRQREILDLIRAEIQRTGFPPTRAEIARALGFRSANAAEDHIKALARKGALELTPGASRGIRLRIDTSSTESIVPAQNTALQPIMNAGLILPVIGRVAAGSPMLAQEHIEREVPVEPSLFSQTPHFLLRVRGASMRDAGILDGDLLAVRKAVEARDGQIIVARLGDDVTVKRLRTSGGIVQLLPENPDFQPITVSPEEDFSLEGVAVGLIRTHTH